MSGASSSPTRLRAKSSGLGDFFRSSPAASTSHDEPRTSSSSAVPDLDLKVPDASKRRNSRIRFLGRGRKKSLHSDASESEMESENRSTRSRSKDTKSEPSKTSEPPSPPPMPSLGSKIAARFDMRTKLFIPPRTSSRAALESLSPPTPSRGPSVDTVSSEHSGSTTPRPTITISPSNDDYEDLFTRRQVPAGDSGNTTPTLNQQFPTFPDSSDDVSLRSSPASILRGLESTDDSERTLTNSSPLAPIDKRRSFPSLPFKKMRSSPTLPLQTAVFLENPRKAPDGPLPPPPPSPTSKPNTSPKSPIFPRQRAQTMITPIPSLSRRNSKGKPVPAKPDKENFDIDTASMEQLKKALRQRTKQLEDLSTFLAETVESHDMVRTALEKKVASLERDGARKDKEIKGLTWLVVNNRPGSAGGSSEAASKSMPALGDIQDTPDPIRSSPRIPQYRRLNDSGGETSGAESPGSESSSFRSAPRVKRNRLLQSNLSHSLSTNNRSLLPDLPLTPSNKRTSISSVSSTSSLIMPSPTSTVKSHLSAIPELSPSSPRPSTPSLPSPRIYSRDPAIAAAIQTAEQLRGKASRSSHRTSSPAITPSQTPAAAYAANLKRGSPSIAQVLNRSPEKITSSSPGRYGTV
ncbi:hypothetical protein C8J56DRAFT_928226 [Mycena floridula]|nr:hypothetical protein C8J56DRAFT_928226 [Mycena floridula]